MGSINAAWQSADLGALDFEPIDLAEARKALDDPPPGIESIHTLAPGYWLSRRRKAEPSDRALTGRTMDWMMALPAALRPSATAQAFPRIANGIAAAWADPAACRALLCSLLNDRRPGRRGFPGPVRRELGALRDARTGDAPPN